MRNFVYWPYMDKDIETAVKLCKGCALVAKAPPIKFNPWQKADLPWSRIYIDFVGLLEGFYYFIVVDSFSKWPEVYRCQNPTTEITIKFLHGLFTRFDIIDTIVSDNRSQFTSREFKDFCESYQIDHIATVLFHPRSNGQAKRFVDTLKKAFKKVWATPTEKAFQQFLHVYRITPNNKTLASQSPAEVIFACRIRSVYDKLLPKQTKPGITNIVPTKRYNPGEKDFFRIFKDSKSFWEAGTIERKVGNMMYFVNGPQFKHKRHLNQLRRRISNATDSDHSEETVMDVIYDTFDIPTLVAPEIRRSKWKRKAIDLIIVNPKCRRY